MLSVLTPVRLADPHRRAVHRHTSAAWSRLGVQQCVAHHDGPGPFNISKAINAARAMAAGDRLLVMGCDHLPPDRDGLDRIHDALDEHPWLGVYAATEQLDRRSTFRVMLEHADPATRVVERRLERCTGILAMRADVFDDLGGYPEAFTGWGYEDTAVRTALATLHGDPPAPPLPVLRSLWHPKAPRTTKQHNRHRYAEFAAAAGDPTRMREVLARHRR
jgi:hypothetical protein